MWDFWHCSTRHLRHRTVTGAQHRARKLDMMHKAQPGYEFWRLPGFMRHPPSRSEPRYPALAQLPEATPGAANDYALASMISNQDAQNVVLVAEADGKLAGMMSITAEVDIRGLQQSMDLHAYDYLITPDAYEAKLRAARPHGKFAFCTRPSAASGDDYHGLKAVAQQLAEFVPDEEDIAAVVQELASATESIEANAFAITMLCLDESLEHQAGELLHAAFEAFPNKDYCLVTLPPESKEPPLLQQFTRLHAPAVAAFPDVLFLFHRHGLISDFQVRPAQADDVGGVVTLVEGMPDRRQTFTSFLDAVQLGAAFVAVCQNQIVGLATLRLKVDLPLLQANFRLSSLLDLAQHTAEGHAEVDVLYLNPIFNHRAAMFLSEIMRHLGKTCLHYALPQHEAAPDILKEFRQVPVRNLCQPQDANDTAFALFVFSHKWFHHRRPAVNSHIVVVGASECGLSAVEQLVTSQQLAFNAITLVAPGGILPGGVGSTVTESLLSKLGLEVFVTIVDAELVALDRQERIVQLSNGQHLQYGVLVLATGIAHQPLLALAPSPDAPLLDMQDLRALLPGGGSEAAPVHNALVYGATLEAYTACADLQAHAAAGPAAVEHVLPVQTTHSAAALVPEAMRLAGIEATMSQRLDLESIHEGPEGSLEVTFKAANGVKHIRECELLVLADTPDVHPAVFQCANSTSLVYDGRLVIDGAFRTADPSIFAAGTLTKLSRRYGRNILLEHYNSREVGARLADSIASFLAAPEAALSETQPLPHLTAARTEGARLPGGNVFVMSATPTAMAAPSLEAPQGGKKLATAVNGAYMHVMLDQHNTVDSVLFCGPEAAFPAAKLASLVGLPASYLNGIEDKFYSGRITHLADFLSEPWADILYHDEFPVLRSALRELTLNTLNGSQKDSTAVGGAHAKLQKSRSISSRTPAQHKAAVLAEAQDAVLAFVKSQGPAQLQAYTLPTAA
ncbi:hypothetical protein WJX72_012281 [[Myrmecia] bisecta]|uniref:Cilia- and flagella-associated protein 61 N-terminal domain-containing protein n=1 Tax=[Myrmecia] bisecta TaxID=41462 RepID=A0AAW1PIA1_9CHLO